MRAVNALLWVLNAAVATVDVVRRRIACLRRGYHRTLEPAGDTCLDCWIFLE